MKNAEKATERFSVRCNCAQSVFSAYAPDLGLDEELALKIASGFGAGMGRQCETCGAVTGAYMVIGLKCGHISSGDKEGKEKTYAMVQEFSRRFKERNQSTLCEQLLGTHLVTGDKEKAERQVKELCPKLVRDSAEILDAMLE